ncbi:MAG: hypothetical protein ACOC7J_01865, partial [Armatimonadota bacterium]
AWHLSGETPSGETREWEPRALEAFIEMAARALGADDADWADSRYVTLSRNGDSDWVVRAQTHRRWDVRLQIRAPKGVFVQSELERELALPTWDEIDGLPKYGKGSRVRVSTRARDYDLITVWGFSEDEIRREAFRSMVARALQPAEAEVAAK